ncbi:MAG: hypothetical protein GC162_08590 [Planctomycetes bacterium]|nr:hypothetical protein [Planctomycetota bacterium]
MPSEVPLHLATLEVPPSHLNAAGRVDRSACLSIDVRRLWRRVPEDEWRRARSAARPGSRRPDAATYREARAHLTLTRDTLDALLARARPFELLGDFRTEKANAMKNACGVGSAECGVNKKCPSPTPNSTLPTPHSTLPTPHSKPRRLPRTFNPNLGAAATKVLPLPAGWTQRLRLERWRLHDKLASHFFFCPQCDARRVKLFLPLCTPDESRDTQLAFKHLTRTHRSNKPLTEHQTRLIERYHLFFPPRSLLCAACLNLRYGYIHPRPRNPRKNDPETFTTPSPTADPITALLSLTPEARRAALQDHLATLSRRRRCHRHIKRLRQSHALLAQLAQLEATKHDDLAFLALAGKLLR